ncbi:Bacteriophage lysis protein [compost metagenome]
MTLPPVRLLLVLLMAALVAWVAFDLLLDELNSARSERDLAQYERDGLREAARITGERVAQAAENDRKHTQELTHALDTNRGRRLAVDSGAERLLVNATCSTTSVSAHSGAAGVADAGTAELAADTRPDYFTLLDQLALSKQMILGLQDHVRSFCPTTPTPSGARP